MKKHREVFQIMYKYQLNKIEDCVSKELSKQVKGIFSSGKLPSSIFIDGEDNCSITEIAKVICKEYLCKDKVNGLACGKCDKCKEVEDYIYKGSSVSQITEVDALSGNLKINSDVIPYSSDKKLFIVDECCTANVHVRNAIIKAIEDGRDDLVFILCSSDMKRIKAKETLAKHSKLLASRQLDIDWVDGLKDKCDVTITVQKPEVCELTNHLLHICQEEGIKTSKNALRTLVINKERDTGKCVKIVQFLKLEGCDITEEIVESLDVFNSLGRKAWAL